MDQGRPQVGVPLSRLPAPAFALERAHALSDLRGPGQRSVHPAGDTQDNAGHIPQPVRFPGLLLDQGTAVARQFPELPLVAVRDEAAARGGAAGGMGDFLQPCPGRAGHGTIWKR